MKNIVAVLLIILCISGEVFSQDTLPNFSVINRGPNRNQVSWINRYGMVKQISIQRSDRPNTNFKTILTVPDPMNRQNGFMDTRAPHDSMYYRLYILIDGGNFIFSKAQRPFRDTELQRVITKSLEDSANLTEEELVILRKYQKNKQLIEKDTIVTQINGSLKEKNKTNLFVPSHRISSNREGNVRIRLDDYDQKKYSIKFFEDDESFLFEIKDITNSFFILDKSNFHHSGWFRFELYDDGKLVEKHKFYIPKDF